MDRGKVSAPAPYMTAPLVAPSSEQLLARLGAYWRALGVSDPDQVAALSQQALRRVAETPESPGSDPVARVILAAGDLLDDWLARVLDLPGLSQELAAARTALLSGAAPDWPAALFAPPGQADAVVNALRVAIAEPTPPVTFGSMPAQQIDLFDLLSPLRRLQRG